MLVGVAFGGAPAGSESLDELAALAQSAGLAPCGRVVARRARPDAALFVGSGKADEIAAQLAAEGIALVVFDQELSAIQQRNLQQRWGVSVVDRTELILEIFAQRARSHEGKLQVELARLEHLSARLVRGWSHLERQRGGIGVRGGPGETQLELDRRLLSVRVKRLRAQLGQLRTQRRTRRRARDRKPAFTVSIVGYTNAGKSTLFNALTGAGTYAADQLFATLDTLTRRLRLPSGSEIVLSDTVGFVRALPHSLVEAFTATLEETAQADLLLHVVDASAPDRDEQIAQVDRVLAEIGAAEVAQILVHNKIDRVGREPEVGRDPCGRIARVQVSAVTGAGLDALRGAIDQQVECWRRARAAPAEASSATMHESGLDDFSDPQERAAPRAA
ncbi:MAG: GTPase HflX [Burkholderiaceae bacterium]|nr:GTPase HflX [Burkholderiaceae bacterium]